MKPHILIVEDQPALYERLRIALVKQRYSVDKYTKSYNQAIERINAKTPDAVLLDIDLEGDLDGIDLGKVLDSKYKIPFIYVTDLDDATTFNRGLNTNHEHYIVKTKPRLNIDDVTRAIQTVLHKKESQESLEEKEGLIGLVGYLDEVKNFGKGGVTRVPVKYKDIAYFTVKPFINENKKEETLRANYLWFLTKDKEYFFLKSSLKELSKRLPRYFVRVNESYIVNISPDMLDGRINGSKLSILNQEIIINSTYKEEVLKRLEQFYQV